MELKRRERRLAVIAAAKEELAARAQARFVRAQAELELKQARREAYERDTGKKARGKAPQPPEPGPQAKDQVNLTDHSNDRQEVAPALARLSALPEALGQVDTLLADTGYHSQDNVARCETAGIEPLIPAARQRHNPPLAERFGEDPPAPGDPSPTAAMAHRLRTRDGKARYAKRKATVETVFGIIKHVLGFRQFLLRGLRAVQGEWALVCIGWNLKRLFALKG